jgi:predicted DCC family thiol-disulfide oxidoreductase YuxK
MGMMPDTGDSGRLLIVYDGDCPLCANFVRLYSIRKNAGDLELINAREQPALVRELRSKGMEINKGMIVTWRGHHYFGTEAMNLLAILGNDSGVIGALNRLLFHNRTIAAMVYPLLAAGRKAMLALLGRKLIPLENPPSPLPPLPLTEEEKSRSPDNRHAAAQAPRPPGGGDTK